MIKKKPGTERKWHTSKRHPMSPAKRVVILNVMIRVWQHYQWKKYSDLKMSREMN